MIETKILDDLARRLAASMPRGVSAFQQDIEKNLRAGLEAVFQRLDLVTREEYEVQVALLTRSRDKLAALEARIAGLESENKSAANTNTIPPPASTQKSSDGV